MRFTQTLVNTGQHYDESLADVFFRQLDLAEPGYCLGVGSGSHATQTANVLERLEPILVQEKPDLVVVFGDVNSTVSLPPSVRPNSASQWRTWSVCGAIITEMPEELNRVVH